MWIIEGAHLKDFFCKSQVLKMAVFYVSHFIISLVLNLFPQRGRYDVLKMNMSWS